MSGIRTNAAAELLGVSPNTLRSWERRFGYPKPRRTPGGHRQYDLSELEVMEESLAVRSVERTVEDLLMPALEVAHGREGREAEFELACRWATGWLHAARRVVPAATRPEGILLFDSSAKLDMESLHVQALELSLRRAGFRVLLLSMGLAQERLSRAMRALDPMALVVCGSGATLDVVGRLVYAVRHTGAQARVYEYRDAMPVSGSHAIPTLGGKPSEAAVAMKAVADGRRLDVPGELPEELVPPAPARAHA